MSDEHSGDIVNEHHAGWLAAHPYATALPGWLRATAAEPRLPVAATIAVAMGLQLLTPKHFALSPRWPVAALEGGLLIALVAANPVRYTRQHSALRVASLVLTAVITFANATSAALLVHNIITGRGGAADNASSLLRAGAAIYLTNVIAFGLWYWEFDRGGPTDRASGEHAHPDFLFPQMASPELARPDWQPEFLDYLYVSFTNATAFSPTDTMPLSRWAKMLMVVQSLIALTTIGLVIARAVNVFK